eukprot:1038478-Amphidinium_carterae.1
MMSCARTEDCGIVKVGSVMDQGKINRGTVKQGNCSPPPNCPKTTRTEQTNKQTNMSKFHS